MYEKEIQALVDCMVKDFERWLTASPNQEYAKVQVQKYKDSVRVDEGKKYCKLVIDGSVRAFIVKQNDGKFKAGDILKPAGWSVPAKNFARGNILATGQFEHTPWTGA